MKLAVYQPWIYLHGGLERTLLELVNRSRHQWTIYTGHYDREGTFPGFADLDVRVLRPTSVNRSIWGVLKSAVQVGRQKLPLDADVDAVVVWCDGLGDLITFRNHHLPIFNVCCTPLRAAFDPSYEKAAMSSRSLTGRVLFQAFKHCFRVVDRRAWRYYSNAIAISEEVKSRIVAGQLFDGDRITIAYPGIDWTPTPANISYEPFALLAGRIMWTKNIELAIRAFLEADVPDPWKLVIAGYVDGKSQSYLAELRRLASGNDRVEFVVSPSDHVMDDLLRRASFCLFTPLNEDWGIVPLEAMARAKPVIANNSGGPRESVIDGYSGYLLPPVASDWASAISDLARDPALVRRLGVQAHGDVRRFTWDRFVAEVDDAVERWVTVGDTLAERRFLGGDHLVTASATDGHC